MLQTFKKATAAALKEIADEKKVRKTDELFLLFSMGSQFDHLIKQKLDALGVFCLVADPASVTANDVRMIKPIGIILSGGPASAYELPPFDGKFLILEFRFWVFAWVSKCGRTILALPVTLSDKREFGTHTFKFTDNNPLFAKAWPKTIKVLESHGDNIIRSIDR